MTSEEAEWPSKIYKNAFRAIDHLPLPFHLGQVPLPHRCNAFFILAMGCCSKRIVLNERSG